MAFPTSPASSADLFERARQLIPGGVNSPVRAFRSVGGAPFFTKSAQGSRLTTADGQELIDYVCTWGPAIHGHNRAEIRDAIAEALANGTSFGTPNPYEVAMAERVVDLVPSVEKVRMVNSGTEATMSAIRLARGFTGRHKVIKFAGCYHGHVDALLVAAGSGALTLGTPDSAGVPPAFASETIVLPYNDRAALEAAFATHGPQIAAVIVEPYPANCGLILPLPGYLEHMRNLCTKHGPVLIFDEVMTGFRVALGGVQEREGITPDLTAMGKIIGGGLPVGAFGGKAEIMDMLAPEGPVYQAGTLSGNPLAMAAGIAALDLLKAENPYPRLAAQGERIASELEATAREKGVDLQIPHVGSMFALFFTPEPVSHFERALSSNKEAFNQVFHTALGNGVYLPPSAYETCFISAAHSDADIDRTIEVLSNAIRKL
ncbi:glutamate-1-semialdehyde 2,1-aminomutase [Cerasicoccus fimbriatus]|uniref:glutamate-1-semialdehyde 2,1-aminomutase n=1 Tax=Cerasicoccus fimbriatus TaxID=3014554 RepID=UPI0022B40B7B|nr:glutamate-1-semialdehyde 2,1-aminomutase [Cerasicoccus sp. TK19100]